MNIQKNNSKHRLFIRLIVLVFAFVMFIPQMTVKAAGTITDQNNNSYSSFADAIAATNEGDNLELTISGSFTENIDISKNINVTITSEADTSISGVIILNNGSLTIQGTSANKLAVNGTMDINNGTFEADYLNVTGTITIGDPSAAKTLATIKNTDINSSSEGIFLHDKNTKLELLDNCTINAVSGIVVNSGADIGTISNSNIQGSFYGVRVQAGHGTETYRDYQIEVDKIVNCNITLLKDESINDVEDTHYTALSFASWGFGDTDITVGSIEECTITTNAKNTWKGAIGAYSYSKFANQEPWGKVRIGSINDCVLTATSGACGLFNQCSDIGEMKNNTITAHNMGAGIAVTVCAYLNGSDPRVETPAAGHIGLIDNNTIKALGPNYGTGIYLSTMFDDVDTIGAIKNSSIEAQRIGIHVHGNSGNIGSIEDTTITQTGANTTAAPHSYGGIILANSDTNDAEHININLIRNLTINSDTYGINVFGGNKISLIDDCEINTVKDAIYNILSEITTIQNTKVVCSESGGYAVYNAGDIDTIKDSDLTTKNSIGIYQTMSTSGNYTKGNIKLIDNVKITNSDPTSRTVSQGIYFAEHHNDDAVVQNCTITGYRRGIENHSKIDKIINNNKLQLQRHL